MMKLVWAGYGSGLIRTDRLWISKMSLLFHPGLPLENFSTKRFDRTLDGGHLERIHFASAMTMTGNNEGKVRDYPASYLDIAEFIQFTEDRTTEDLHQLWRRIVFSVAISNTDDHLRNHAFILTPQGWRLSPAYDINPSIDRSGLSLNIDAENNALDFEVVQHVREYFQLTQADANRIMGEVRAVVSTWSVIATDLGIPRAEQLLMAGAFRY
jgi:serine/threonine-protein kinase HipA